MKNILWTQQSDLLQNKLFITSFHEIDLKKKNSYLCAEMQAIAGTILKAPEKVN